MPVAGADGGGHGQRRRARPGHLASRDGRDVQPEGAREIPTTRDPWAVLRQVPGVLVDDMNAGSGRRPRDRPPSSARARTRIRTATTSMASRSAREAYRRSTTTSIRSRVSRSTTGGSDPSFATPGVSVNLVTKRGTNQLLGSARGLYTGGAGWDYGIEAGGPVWKDHLWLWGASRNAFLGRTLSDQATGEPVDNQETLKHWNAKLNAQLSPSNTLTLSGTDFDRSTRDWAPVRMLSCPTTITNTFDQASVPARGLRRSCRRTLCVSLGFFREGQVGSPPLGVSRSRPTWTRRRSGATATRTGGSRIPASGRPERLGFLRHGRPGARAQVRVRLQHARARLGVELARRPARWLRNVRLRRGRDHAPRGSPIPRSNTYDVFLGDTIQAGNLTVNVGARFDYQQGKNLPSAVPANPVFPSFFRPSYTPATRDTPSPGAWSSRGWGRHMLLNDSRHSAARFVFPICQPAGQRFTVAINAFPDIAELHYPLGRRQWERSRRAGRSRRFRNRLLPRVDPDNPGSPYRSIRSRGASSRR